MLGELCGSEFAAKAETVLKQASRKPAQRCRSVAEIKEIEKERAKERKTDRRKRE